MEGLGTVLTSLAGVLIALGTFMSQLSKRDRSNRKADARLIERYRLRDKAALAHILRMELLFMDKHDNAPDRPAELSPGWLLDDDDKPTKQVTT